METWRLSLLPSVLRWLFALLAAFGIMMLSLEGTTAFTSEPQKSNRHGFSRPLSFEERVDAQRSIEEVLWRHRIWPADNPRPKPPLSAVLSDAVLRAKVTDTLAKSSALEKFWGTPVTEGLLQSEMDRMARESRQPQVLREMFEAMHDDPFMIAETLARPALADRMLREAYDRDTRLGWPKTSADRWWDENRSTFNADAPLTEGSFSEPTLDDAPCANDTWAPTSLVSAPAARAQHSMIWTGAEVIVWGGHPGVSGPYLQDGGRYVPATDSWTPMTIAGAPEGRIFYTTVWTGTEMIVWGGENNLATKLNTGGRYNPAADTWTPTGTGTGVPVARRFHGSVWTGTEVIVWGGQGSTNLSSGGRYNPSTDTWSATGMGANLPAPGSTVQAWTGSVMVVLGGTPLVGGLYNPSTDSWSAVSTGPSNSGRASVWTGAEVILWNGTTGISRFNPATNQWTQTTASGAPLGITAETAVWGNGEMIVWGGYQTFSSSPLNTGGRYDPASNTWTATGTAAGVPAARYNHRAVWDGTEMIVWGGTNNSSNALDTGGRYCRSCDPSFTHYRDADSDTFGTSSQPLSTCNATSIAGFVTASGDCVDSDSTTYPGAPQLCDGLNNDCLDPNWPAVPANEANADNDLYRICQGDCDDSQFTVYPGAPQLCDGLNNDCLDGAWPTPPANEADQDGDGKRICSPDCFDTNPNVWAPPREVAALLLAPGPPTLISWLQDPTSGPETAYDLVSGTLTAAGMLDLSAGSCLQTAGPNSYNDSRPNPALASSYWYLARGANSCGIGTYGVGSFGLDRDGTIPPCP